MLGVNGALPRPALQVERTIKSPGPISDGVGKCVLTTLNIFATVLGAAVINS